MTNNTSTPLTGTPDQQETGPAPTQTGQVCDICGRPAVENVWQVCKQLCSSCLEAYRLGCNNMRGWYNGYVSREFLGYQE